MSLWQYLWAMTIPKSILIDTAIYLGARLRRFSMNHYTIKFELRITCSRSQHFEKLRNIPKTFGTKIDLELRRLIFWHQLKTSEKKTDQTSRRWRVYLVCHSPNFFFEVHCSSDSCECLSSCFARMRLSLFFELFDCYVLSGVTIWCPKEGYVLFFSIELLWFSLVHYFFVIVV